MTSTTNQSSESHRVYSPQFIPSHPVPSQSQVYVFLPSMHIPSWRQGSAAHSSQKSLRSGQPQIRAIMSSRMSANTSPCKALTVLGRSRKDTRYKGRFFIVGCLFHRVHKSLLLCYSLFGLTSCFSCRLRFMRGVLRMMVKIAASLSVAPLWEKLRFHTCFIVSEGIVRGARSFGFVALFSWTSTFCDSHDSATRERTKTIKETLREIKRGARLQDAGKGWFALWLGVSDVSDSRLIQALCMTIKVNDAIINSTNYYNYNDLQKDANRLTLVLLILLRSCLSQNLEASTPSLLAGCSLSSPSIVRTSDPKAFEINKKHVLSF